MVAEGPPPIAGEDGSPVQHGQVDPRCSVTSAADAAWGKGVSHHSGDAVSPDWVRPYPLENPSLLRGLADHLPDRQGDRIMLMAQQKPIRKGRALALLALRVSAGSDRGQQVPVRFAGVEV